MNDKNAFSAYEGEIRRILQTSQGQALLQLLSRSGGDTLRQAAQAVQTGEYEAAKSLLAPLLQSPQAMQLLQELTGDG